MGRTKRGLERGSHAGPACLPAYLGEHPALALCTLPRKALILSALFALAVTFRTPPLDLTTGLEFTTDLNSIPDRSLENTQAFQWSQTLPASWKKPLRPHLITTQFTQRAFSVKIIQISLVFIMTGVPDQPNTSLGSDSKSQIKNYLSHISRSPEVGCSSLI